MEFDIRNEGSLVLFTPLDDAAKEWWEENVESAQTFGPAYVVEHRYASGIIEGISAAKEGEI